MAGKRDEPPPPEPPRPLVPSIRARFKRGYKLQSKRGRDMAKLEAVMASLIARQPLEPRRQDHALTGDWTGCRECHVEPDWLLIYEADDDEIRFLATGSHSDLFG